MLIKGNTQLSKSLNPYSTGSNSNSVTAFQPVCLLVVLILILLEVTQIFYGDPKYNGTKVS